MELLLLLLLLLCLSGPLFYQLVCSAPIKESIRERHLQGGSKFWHLSDLHFDPTYHVNKDPTKVCFSSKGVPVTDPGLFGDFMCDSPYQLIQSAFSHMKHVDQQPDFIIWTGYEIFTAKMPIIEIYYSERSAITPVSKAGQL